MFELQEPFNKSQPFSEENVLHALIHLDNLNVLSQHSLAECLAGSEGISERKGKRVREELIRIITYLDRPDRNQLSRDKISLSYECLRYRYIDRYSAQECCQKLGIEADDFQRMCKLGVKRLSTTLAFLILAPTEPQVESTNRNQESANGIIHVNRLNQENDGDQERWELELL